MDIQSAKDVILAAILAEDAVIMEGVHGIGKSNIVKQLCQENNYHLEELFLSHQEVGDIIGMPRTINIGDEVITTWSKPIWLQRMEKASKEGKFCVLFLDELNRAPTDVRQSALQLVLEGKIHEHTLPSLNGKRTAVVSAINPADDYQVDELDPALLDRFLFITVEADAPAWLNWARNTGVNQVVRDFIAEHPDRLHWNAADGGIGASPRSWAKLGCFMDHVAEIKEEILFQIMKGKIGTEIASQFYSFYKNYTDVIKVSDIEELVHANKEEFESIEELSNVVALKIAKTEAIQKAELAIQLRDKYVDAKDMLVFLVYLYALDIEICVSFLKSFRADDAAGYKKLVQLDTHLNNKNLFKRIVTASDRD